jgi:ribokinase
VAPIFVEPNGQNRILVVKGANDALKPADVDAAAETVEGRRLHRLAVRNSAGNRLLHRRICAKAWNPLHPESRSRRNQSRWALADLDYFVPNESEAEAVSPACRLKMSKTRKNVRSS